MVCRLALVFLAVANISFIHAEKRVVCYWQGIIEAVDIDPNICTHIIYSFVGIDDLGEFYYANADARRHILSMAKMKEKNPRLQTMAAIGGANDQFSKAFSILSRSIDNRARFVVNAVTFLKQNFLSGIDIDWEFPSSAEERKNFGLLLIELKESLKVFNFTLSIAVAPDKWRAQEMYDIRKISQVVDFINLMTYDFHGAWSLSVGHHAQMYPHHTDSDYMKELNCASSVTYWLQKGAPADKLTLGIPTYGKTFVLSQRSEHVVGSEINSNQTKLGVINIGYNEFCSSKGSDWTQHFDNNFRVYYAVKGLIWFGFDTPQQIEMKASFVEKYNLGGVMFWSLDTDDFNATCKNGIYPQISAAFNKFTHDQRTLF